MMVRPLERLKNFVKAGKNENLMSVDGYVPFKRAGVFAFEQVLVMFLSNVTPILVVFGSLGDHYLTVNALTGALLWAGIGTILQCLGFYPFGSKLPNLMGTSFTFIGALMQVNSTYNDLGVTLLSALIGALFLMVMGLFAKYWRRFIPPLVSAVVLIAVGLELAELGAEQFFAVESVLSLSTDELYSFGNGWPFILCGFISLTSAIIWNLHVKGAWRNIHIIVGLLMGYICALILNAIYPALHIIDFSYFGMKGAEDYINVPRPFDLTKLKFNWEAVLFICLIYLVSSSESSGDMVASAHVCYNRTANDREISGGLFLDGLISACSCLFGGMPITTSTENVGFAGKTGIINRYVAFLSGVMMIILSFFPPVAVFFESIPSCVLGGAMIMVYMSILLIGFEMISRAGFTRKNIIVLSVTLGLGYGTSLLGKYFFNTTTFTGQNVLLGFMMGDPEVSMFLISLVLCYLIKDTAKNDFASEDLKIHEAKEERLEEVEYKSKGVDDTHAPKL
ncbi:MAG: hypothetical protein LKJ88_04880 [Bacilli bacterium]|jgi:NCS2 family nucleobase:cation symporter-2|nr:hypothetical protein [Bacilli bacterium]